MISNKILSTVTTKTGTDVTVEFTNTETEEKHQKTFAFISQREIDHDLNNRMLLSANKMAAKIEDEKIKKDWSREELEILLKEKGYLKESEKVEDLPQKTVETKK